MSSRVTRSAARRAVESTDPPHPSTTRSSKKRKASHQRDSSPAQPPADANQPTPPRRSKRQKTTTSPPHPQGDSEPRARRRARKSSAEDTVMSNNGSSSKYTEEPTKVANSKSTRRTTSRSNKKPARDTSPSTHTLTASRKKKSKASQDDSDVHIKSEDNTPSKAPSREDGNESPTPPPRDDDDSLDAGSPRDDDDGSDPFTSALFGSGRVSSTLRALSGMMSGMSSRFKDILTNLRQNENSTMQLVALEELSNLLLVSNEDNLSGHFSPDPYIKELVALMQPNPITGEENPELMLLACRCIANLMEAMRGSVANVVYGGAVPVLCQKLLDIQYIDVAEQALSTLSKISIDFPASIVREGGLTACLQFLDFFATGTQRTAVTTAANCCRNIPHDSFAVIKDVMPILQNVLDSHDQKVVEQGCLCVTRVIDSFKHSSDKLEQLVEPALLKAVLGLLLPGTTNLIGANIHTEFLRVLAIVARASPTLSAELLRMKVVDTLYQILTGVSPPDETSDAASKIDSVVIMQALIHRPREQVYETLNVICELLPPTKANYHASDTDTRGVNDDVSDGGYPDANRAARAAKRLELLEGCREQTRRFAVILIPTLTDAYSSTVNLSVRQKVLTAQLKMLSNLETAVIEEALKPVPYASFLASILSQEDHPTLVMCALQASELLFDRLENIYQYQFHREGVIGEIQKIASREPAIDSKNTSARVSPDASLKVPKAESEDEDPINEKRAHPTEDHEGIEDDSDDDDAEARGSDQDEDDQDREDDEAGDETRDEIAIQEDPHIDDDDDDDDDDSDSSAEELTSPFAIAGIQDLVVIRAKKFLEKYDTSKGRDLREKAKGIREDLQALGHAIQRRYAPEAKPQRGANPFEQLAAYFAGNALESITSSELLDSGIIRILVDALASVEPTANNPRGDFLAAFMGSAGSGKIKTTTASTSSTALTVLILKLQDLLSRGEHFEVMTVNNNASESSRSSSTSMLSRQLRLRLSADSDSEIPQSYREMIVSIHAIATFKALDDYLRPRFSLPDRGAINRRREMLAQLANARLAQLSGAAESGLFSPFGQELGGLPSSALADLSSSLPSSRAKSKPEKAHSEAMKSEEKSERRRSLRRSQASASSTAPVLPPPEPSTENEDPKLEAPDEKQIEDEPAVADPGDETLEAFVDGIDDDVSDDDLPEPGAVNMEVASTGKVTARQEDGTRIVTPQPGTPVPGASRSDPTDSPSLASRALAGSGRPSYAAALQSTPQDWHIEFSIDGNVIPNDTTIYRAVHHNRDATQDASTRGIWSGVHTVKFRKVKGPAPSASTLAAMNKEKSTGDGELPESLNDHPITSSILLLLRIVHELNASLDDVRETLGQAGLQLYPEPLASFINTKLTAKMNRQLEEPLIVASNCLPDWAEDLARGFPFLFPFETRHLFLQSTSFGYSRSITRWQSSQNESDDRRDRRRDDRPLMGRPQRQKVRISRSKILESAMKVMEMYGASPSVLEVEYFNEVGTGLGPTLEFYSTVSKEFSKKKLKMWRENDFGGKGDFAFGKNGLFPSPMSDTAAKLDSGKKLLHFFKMLGKFVARSMLDSRIIDIAFSPIFFKLSSSPTMALSIGLLRAVDQDLANSLAQLQQFANAKANIDNEKLAVADKQRALSELRIKGATIEDLMLDFTLPGYPSIELIKGGGDMSVTMDNVQDYIDRVLDMSLGQGVRRQMEAFQVGFSQVFSFSSLKAFTPNELVMLFGRVEEDWSIETLMDSVKADHGFNMDSKSVKNLLQTMSELTAEQRRDFLQFVTGSPKLPIGGFKSLTPMFTVVCKPSEPPYTSDDYLPSVMTCVNYLKLPDYSDQDVLKDRLGWAIKEGQGAFHLS